MTTLSITYDLRTPGKDYTQLINAIMRFPMAVHYQQSAWVVKSAIDAPTARDMLLPFVDRNDLLFVAQTSAAAWNDAQASKCGQAIRSAY